MELTNGKVEALGCIEYKVAKDDIRAYKNKLEGSHDELRQAGTSWCIEKAEESELVKKVQQIAVRIHRVMGCKDFSQYDCRVTEEGKVYVLEVNSFCSFGPMSLLPKLDSFNHISMSKMYIEISNKSLENTQATNLNYRQETCAYQTVLS